MNQRAYGFTIVELLIVIVVIAILATLSYVGYTGISQRANNASIINAASSIDRVLQAYIAEQDRYPLAIASSSVTRCLLLESGCQNTLGTVVDAGASILDEVSSVGRLPDSVPFTGDSRNGVFYEYRADRTVDGVSQPLVLIYWLQGTNQQCGNAVANSTDATTIVATRGYTVGNEGGKTRCNMIVRGPLHS